MYVMEQGDSSMHSDTFLLSVYRPSLSRQSTHKIADQFVVAIVPL